MHVALRSLWNKGSEGGFRTSLFKESSARSSQVQRSFCLTRVSPSSTGAEHWASRTHRNSHTAMHSSCFHKQNKERHPQLCKKMQYDAHIHTCNFVGSWNLYSVSAKNCDIQACFTACHQNNATPAPGKGACMLPPAQSENGCSLCIWIGILLKHLQLST